MLKNIPVVELIFVASGFLLRVLGGAAATHVPPSAWFLLVCSLGALGRGDGQALHRTSRPRPGRDPAPPGAALVPLAALLVAPVADRRRDDRGLPGLGRRGAPSAQLWHLVSAIPLAAALIRFGMLTARHTAAPVEDLLTRNGLMLTCELTWLACS